MINIAAIDLKTKASALTLIVLLFISLLTISGGTGRSPVTDQKVSTGRLAGSTGAVRSSRIFYQSFIQKMRSINFRHAFLSCSNTLLLLIKSKLIQIQIINNLMKVLLLIPISFICFTSALSYPQEQPEPFFALY